MASTTNLNLVKPAGTDKALVSVINSNSDKIDAFAGTTNQAISTLNSNLTKIQSGQVTGITLAANSQTEVTVTLKQAFASGTDYVAVASIEFYSTAQTFSAVLIRSKSYNSFVCRIYNSGSSDATDVKLNWVVMPV